MKKKSLMDRLISTTHGLLGTFFVGVGLLILVGAFLGGDPAMKIAGCIVLALSAVGIAANALTLVREARLLKTGTPVRGRAIRVRMANRTGPFARAGAGNAPLQQFFPFSVYFEYSVGGVLRTGHSRVFWASFPVAENQPITIYFDKDQKHFALPL